MNIAIKVAKQTITGTLTLNNSRQAIFKTTYVLHADLRVHRHFSVLTTTTATSKPAPFKSTLSIRYLIHHYKNPHLSGITVNPPDSHLPGLLPYKILNFVRAHTTAIAQIMSRLNSICSYAVVFRLS